MRAPMPIVLIEIDRNSSVNFRQTDGVHVALIDHRVDPLVVLFPEANETEAIMAALGDLKVVSSEADDLVRSAAATIRRVRAGFTIVRSGPVLVKETT